jgi:DNA-binding CsgD family transcriptional regulator
MELAFAWLHQLCAPLLDYLPHLPAPQRKALQTAFGISAGPAPDRFLIGLAVLGLLSEAAWERPLACLVDDVQWLDRASAQVLGFVARRLAADPVGLVFATRESGEELAGLPELVLEGLEQEDARALLDSVLTESLDARVRDQVLAESRGNPLALLELPRGLSPADLAGGFGLPGAVPVTGRIEESFRRQLDVLPPQTRRLLLLTAAEPTGDALLVSQAARGLGIPAQAQAPAVEAGLAEFGASVRFRHPLLRSVAYRSASWPERQEVHAALAEATDQAVDPDRRAWHRAAAATSPDEEVAAELERSAGRAQARGGLAAAAAFLERAVTLTADPARRAGLALTAAQTHLRAGAFHKARELLTVAETGPLNDCQDARVELVRVQIAFASGLGSVAPPLLLKAAKRLESLDLDLARQTYVDAWQAAFMAGHLAGAGDLLEVSRGARSLSAPADPPRLVDLALDAFALLVTDGPAVAAPRLRQATRAFASPDAPAEQVLRWSWIAAVADEALWDDQGWSVTVKQVRLARDAGALGQLPILLNRMGVQAVWTGDFAAAAALVAEASTVCEATGAPLAPVTAMMLAAFQGREAEVAALTRATIAQATAGGQGISVTVAHWVTAVLHNGLGRYPEALAAARQASEHKHVYVSMWALPELIEAAARTGNPRVADSALDLLAETTQASGSDLGLGIEARSRALLGGGPAAEAHYREAIDRLGRARRRPEVARAHLLYGEWLRRERRRHESQEQLRTAYRMLDAIGMDGFAERARRELLATGETVTKRAARPGGTLHGEASEPLTAQEAQVARLAHEGLSNPEIATRLFISTRTVQYHLSKVFAKLGIKSRGQLHQVLQEESQ